MARQMDCKDVQERIHAFVTDEIDERDVVPFISHIQECKDCRQDLTLSYLLIIGLKQLDEDGPFDIEYELQKKISKRLEKSALRKQVRFMAMTIAVTGAIVAGYFIAMSMFY